MSTVPESVVTKVERAARCAGCAKVNCQQCNLMPLCLPFRLDAAELALLEQIMQHRATQPKGRHIYRQRDPFESIYMVRTGTLKGYRIDNAGNEQVLGFYYPGDIFGVDGISTNEHSCSTSTLEAASVCAIPFNLLDELCTRIPALQQRLFQLIGGEIAREQLLVTLIGKYSAERRLAAMLLGLSSGNVFRHAPAHQLRLPMTRADIGSYLGMVMESVSRAFAHLHKNGAIAVDGKNVLIKDFELLSGIASGQISADLHR